MGDEDLDPGDAALSELDPEERASLTDQQVAAVQRPPALVGRFRLHRLARDIMPFWCGALLVPIVAGLGAPLAAAALAAVTVRPTPPRFLPAAQRPGHLWVLKTRFRFRDGRSVRLAPGQLFQTRPQRRPVGTDQLAGHLRRLAREAGLTVTTTDNDLGAWRARRPDPPR